MFADAIRVPRAQIIQPPSNSISLEDIDAIRVPRAQINVGYDSTGAVVRTTDAIRVPRV